MSDVNDVGEVLGTGCRIRFSGKNLVSFRVMIGLLLELGSWFNIRVRAKLRFRDMMRSG